MKKTVFLIILPLFILTACATKPAEKEKQPDVETVVTQQDETDLNAEPQTDKKNESEKKSEPEIPVVVIPRFDDWKYIGFGNDVPEWVEPAVSGDMDKLKQIVLTRSGLEATEIDVALFYGLNLDHAEKRSEQVTINAPWEVYDSFWVRINRDFEELEEPYVLVQLLVKK